MSPGAPAPLPLVTRGLGRSYGRLVALDELSLTVAGGECVALIGVNGSGKSTAVRMIAGLLTPSRGELRICGWDPYREPEAERARAALAVVPDAPLLYEDLPVRQHLELVAMAHGVPDEEIDERIDAWLDRLDLVARGSYLPRELSRGMRQKAQLACALMRPAVASAIVYVPVRAITVGSIAGHAVVSVGLGLVAVVVMALLQLREPAR